MSWYNEDEDMVERNEMDRWIKCLKWLNTMRKKPPRLQMDFTESSVPRIQWCTAGGAYKMRERCGVEGFLNSTISCCELRVGGRNQTSPVPSLSSCKWSRSLSNPSLSSHLAYTYKAGLCYSADSLLVDLRLLLCRRR